MLCEMFRRGDDKALAALTVQDQVVVNQVAVHFGRIYQSSIKIRFLVSIKLLDYSVESIDIWEIPTKDGAHANQS